MELPLDHYPAWLGTDLLNGALPWEAATVTTLPAFLAEYTLHDSAWVGFQLDPSLNGGGLAVIRWDTYWTEGRVPFPGSTVVRWPILLVEFQRVYATTLRGYETEAPVPTRGIGAASSTELQGVDRAGRHRTTIDDHYGGTLEIVHHPQVRLLCLSADREVLAIPGRYAG